MSPDKGVISFIIILNKVDFPIPLAPIRATFSPRYISKLRSLNKILSPYPIDISLNCRTSFPLVTEGLNSILAFFL